MAKITVLEQKTYQGKPSGFKVTLDDGRSGNVQEKESDKGLRVGDEVTVKEIPYTSKAGVQSTLYGLKLVGTGASFPPPPNIPNLPPKNVLQSSSPLVTGVPPQDVFKAKVEANIRLMDVVLNAFFDGKTDNLKSVEKFNEWKVIMENTIDEIARER